jgi:hypothetical protein
MKNKKSVEPMFDYTKFKSHSIRMSPQKFMSLPDFYRNRDVELRIPKLVKRLEKGASPTHLRVAVGKVMKPFGGYKTNQYIKLDGHGRCGAYKVCPHLIPNVDLVVDVYEVSSHEEAMVIYNDIDSQESVENACDKLTGMLRQRKFTAKTQTIKKGNIATVLNKACRYVTTPDGVYLNGKEYNRNIEPKLDYFLEEMKYLDSFGLTISKATRISANVFATFLLLAKKYGVKNKRLTQLIENYRDDETEVYDGTNTDGVYYVYNVLYSKKIDIWSINSYSTAPSIVGSILYAFDKFMNHKTISKKSKYPSDSKLREFYQYYLS